MIKQTPLFKELVKSKRREMREKARTKTRKQKKLKSLYPFTTERAYKKKIKELMKPIIEMVEFEILGNLPRWIEEYKITMNRDSYSEDMPTILQKINAELRLVFEEGGPQVRTMLTNIGYEISDKNKKQFMQQMKLMTGIEFITTEAWELEVIKSWAEANFQLLNSLPTDYIKKINTFVSEGVQYGESANSIRKKIKGLDEEITDKRAGLIARDQVAKLQSNISQRRMEDAGIDMYIWVTAGDERVRGKPGGKYPKARPRHDIMEGLICRWDDPTVFLERSGGVWRDRTGDMPMVHPGIAILCRCQSIPFFEEFLEEIDKELEDE